MRLINRQYIPGYGDLRVVSGDVEILTILAAGHAICSYDSIGKLLFYFMGEYVLIPFDIFEKKG